MSDPDGWVTNTTTAAVARRLGAARSVVLLTHAKPDGDALGSTLALARAINLHAGATGAASVAECWYQAPMPPWSQAICGTTKVRVIEQGQPVPAALDPEVVLVADTGAWRQLDTYAPWLEERADRAIVIDHHLRGSARTGAARIVDTTAAAVCQPVAEVCCAILGVDGPARLPKEIGEPLYLGLATDTGWFRHSNVAPAVMRLAGDLLETGLDHARLYELVEQRERASRLRLLRRALETLEIVDDKRLAVMSLTPADFEAAGAIPGESGGFVDLTQQVERVRVAALLTEQKSDQGPVTKISLRSKEGPWDGRPAVDVNAVADRLGGGGHARAAGARVTGTIEDAKRMLIEALP